MCVIYIIFEYAHVSLYGLLIYIILIAYVVLSFLCARVRGPLYVYVCVCACVLVLSVCGFVRVVREHSSVDR